MRSLCSSLPAVEGTGRYPELAVTHRLAALVTGGIEEHGARQTATLLIWNGATGSVIGRWSVSGPATKLPRILGRGFWKNLGPTLHRAETPVSPVLRPAPPIRIDAADMTEEPLAVHPSP